MVDSADHIAGKTGLSPTVTISKNGGSFGSPSGSITEIANGWYSLAGNATDRNTVGEFVIHATGSGADPTDDRYTIVPWDPFDIVRLGLTGLANANPGEAGGLATYNNLTSLEIDGNVNDASATTTVFIGNSGLSSSNDFYNRLVLVFTNGTLKGVGRRVSDYVGSTRSFTFGVPFPVAPTNGDLFSIIGLIE